MSTTSLDVQATSAFVEKQWNDSVISTLSDYIRIPNQSPLYDKEWATNGHTAKAVELLVGWAKSQGIRNSSLEVVQEGGRTPVIFMEISGTTPELDAHTVLLYGHLDKQPPLTEAWAKGLGPWTPVIRDGKLYGRGGADDGYALFSTLTAIRALQEQNIPHARYVVIIEACEESGSYDLPFYVDYLEKRIRIPELVVCLDSGCGNYEQFWLTSSLRGLVVGTLTITILHEGVHSGLATGIVPSTFRILRQLLDRVEDINTGEIRDAIFSPPIPEARLQQARDAAAVLGDEIWQSFPFVQGASPVGGDNVDRLLNRTWRPQLEIIGAEGLPSLGNAGNVLRPTTSVKLSLRMPPHGNAEAGGKKLKEILEANPPYGAQVKFTVEKGMDGWASPILEKWLDEAAGEASKAFFEGREHRYIGEGGSIPFMGMLGKKFPQAQFLITGLLGPGSNAHGPNEFMHIACSKNVTKSVAYILAKHAEKSK